MKQPSFSPRGFTLVEIMIVVAIIGILVAVAVPGYLRARESSRQIACMENMLKIDQALQQYVLMENADAEVPVDIDLDYLVGEESYIRNMPVCPSGGTYALHAPNDTEPVTCSIGDTARFPHRFLTVARPMAGGAAALDDND